MGLWSTGVGEVVVFFFFFRKYQSMKMHDGYDPAEREGVC